MTRKRFIKLLMAHGYQIREAEACAWIALSEYGEYRLAWKNRWHALAVMRQRYKTLTDTREMIRGMVQGMVEGVLSPLAERIREMVQPILDAVKEHMREGIPYA